MIEDHNGSILNKINRYKFFVSVILGLAGFIGIFYSTRYDFNGFSINFTWSILIPLLVTLAWGVRYGIISITLGLVGLYPFFLGSYNGWASIVPTISLYLWIIIHGYGSQKRLKEHEFYFNVYFLQFIYIIIRMLIYVILFPILIQFNPPFWNPEAYTKIEISIIILFAIKGIIVETIFLALCDALLLLPFVRRVFRLECSKGSKYNTRIMLVIVIFGLVFTLVVSVVNNFIIDKIHPLEWLVKPNEKVRITFLLGSILFTIMGGITIRFVQRMLESQEALEIREKQYQRANEEIQILNNELEQRVIERTSELQNAVWELEEFSYTISHDLKSPIRAIDGYSTFIIEDYGDTLNGEVPEMLSIIQETCSDMIILINKLLEYSMTSKAKLVKEEVQVKQIILTVFREFEIGDPLRNMQLCFEGDFPILNLDRVLFRQAITNIISNAVKFSKHRDVTKILVGCNKSNNEYIFHIGDNGVGFDMKYSNKLFGIFQRLHRTQDFEGTGIGLATIKKIFQKHDGRVWIEAVLNEGATVYFTLPENKLEDEI